MTTREFTLADMLAIQALVHSYPRHLDSGDLVGVGLLFARASVHFQGRDRPVVCDPDEITRMFADFVRLYDGKPRTRHLMANLVITPEGPEAASATCSVLVVQQVMGRPLQPIITGDYQDRFAKSNSEWHFTERHITNDLFGDLSAHGKYAFTPPA